MIELDIWFTQFGVRTQKLCKSQVSDSCCAKAAASPTPLPSTSFLATRPLGTPNVPLCTGYTRKYKRYVWKDFTMDRIATTRSKLNQIQGNQVADLWWPSTTQWKLIGCIWWKFQVTGLATPHVGPKQPTTDFRRQSGTFTRRSVPDGANRRLTSLGEAGRPHMSTSETHLCVKLTQPPILCTLEALGIYQPLASYK